MYTGSNRLWCMEHLAVWKAHEKQWHSVGKFERVRQGTDDVTVSTGRQLHLLMAGLTDVDPWNFRFSQSWNFKGSPQREV
jgi:hypothetical protein